MKMKGKAISAEEIFPVAGLFKDIAVSVKGNLTIGWEVYFPAAYTISETTYDSMISSFSTAIRALSPWMVVHRMDTYLYEKWCPPSGRPKDFLTVAHDQHNYGRQYLEHRSFIFLTLSSRDIIMQPSSSVSIFGSPKTLKVPSGEVFADFIQKGHEFETIITSGKRIHMRRLGESDWFGTPGHHGVIGRTMMLGQSDAQWSDILPFPDSLKVFDKKALIYKIGSSNQLQEEVNSIRSNKDLEREGVNKMLTSLGAAIGQELECEHIVNQIYIVTDQEEERRRINDEQKKMIQFSSTMMSSDNVYNANKIEEFKIEENESRKLLVRSHVNVIAWAEGDRIRELPGKIRSAFSKMDVVTTRVEQDVPVIYNASLPCCASDILLRNTMTMELESALCLAPYESTIKDIPGGNFTLNDRITHKPVFLDTMAAAKAAGYIDDYNAVIIGPTGTGKSFLVNNYLHQVYQNGAQVSIIDEGKSYETQTLLVAEESGGKDGQYFSWSSDNRLSFNPFTGCESWLNDAGTLDMENPGLIAFQSNLMTIWQPEKVGWTADRRGLLTQFIKDFLLSYKKKTGSKTPIFQDFYEFLHKTVLPAMEKNSYDVKGNKWGLSRFDFVGFRTALGQYSLDGEYGYLLNDENPKDLFNSRWVTYELSAISGGDQKFYQIVLLNIIRMFDRKMREHENDFKVLALDEAWKHIANDTIGPYMGELWRTARKYSTSAMMITQNPEDLNSSVHVRDIIQNNSSIRMFLDVSEKVKVAEEIVEIMGLPPQDKDLLFSVGKGIDARYGIYKEVFFSEKNAPSMVLANEVSFKEATVFESEFKKKEPILKHCRELGSIRKGIEDLAERRSQRQ